MDPDAALAAAREANRLSQITPGADNAALDLAMEALDHYVDLDEWLTKGGFRPKAWIPSGPAADVGHEVPDLSNDRIKELERRQRELDDRFRVTEHKRGCSCGEADYGTPGHDHDDDAIPAVPYVWDDATQTYKEKK